MKRLSSIIACGIFSIAVLSCSSDNDDTQNPIDQCANAVAATAAAEQAFNTATDANYSARCAAYKAALQAEINTCGDANGELQLIIDDLGDCVLDTTTGVITVTVGSLVKTFETNITINVIGSTMEIRAEDDANSTDFIYFEIQQGQTGADAISNFNIHLLSSDYNPLPDSEGGNWTSNITVNSATEINGTFYGYVTSPTTGADLDLNLGSINIDL